MTADEILAELKRMGSESYRNLLMRNHGVREPCFGVKISDLKTIQKKVKKDHLLALDLYATGNYDAMYLAGLIADDSRMTRNDLGNWAEMAHGGSLPGYTVPWVAAGSPFGWELGLEWINSTEPHLAQIGWSTLGFVAQLKQDKDLDLAILEGLFHRIGKTIHSSPDSVRYAMNQFIIMVGTSVAPLKDKAIAMAEQVGTVTADLGNNNCQIPSAAEYIRKAEAKGAIGKKKKTVKC